MLSLNQFRKKGIHLVYLWAAFLLGDTASGNFQVFIYRHIRKNLPPFRNMGNAILRDFIGRMFGNVHIFIKNIRASFRTNKPGDCS
jgi:hypothetical protein